MWLKRIAREWLVLAIALVSTASSAATSAGWIETVTGKSPPQGWVYLSAFILFAAVVIIRLVRLQTQIDEGKEKIRVVARPSFYALNHPMRSEQPLGRDEASVHTDIYFEIWADTDVDTAKLILNIVGVRRKSWWKLWELVLPGTKRMVGIRIEGQDSPMYRKQIRQADAQPFEDHATFKWRGKRELVEWGGSFLLELALETGRPRGIWRAVVDPRLYERGATAPL